MAQKVLVIGAGILGAATAYELQKAGSEVTIVDSGIAGATQASFGWINASFYLDADHFRLRQASINAYRQLSNELGLPIDWCGCLCFEQEGAEFDAQASALEALEYPFEIIEGSEFRQLVPAISDAPERCLRFEQEAAADSGALAQMLVQAAQELGAIVVRGVSVEGFETQNGRVTGARTTAGGIEADQVVCAVGTTTGRLLAAVGVPLPMLKRPGAMIRTQPIGRVSDHILVSPIGEIRQLADGSLMMPTTISHQSDTSDQIGSVMEEANGAMARLQELLPSTDLRLADVMFAERPIPQDGFPAVGEVRDGLYVLCAHSGVTLGAILGQLAAREVRDGPTNETARMLAPYRPDRF